MDSLLWKIKKMQKVCVGIQLCKKKLAMYAFTQKHKEIEECVQYVLY